MKKVEYIIVGQGFAGAFFAFELMQNNIPFVVYDNGNKSASKVAAGVFNPIVLKRFNPIWKGKEQVELLIRKSKQMESFLNSKILERYSVNRIFYDKVERNTWLQKANEKEFQDYLNPKIQTQPKYIKATYGLGEVKDSGRVLVQDFFQAMENYQIENKQYIQEKFQYRELKHLAHSFQYKEYETKKVVFCEGMGLVNNPYFDYIPLTSNKGECITVKADQRPKDNIYKKRHFYFRLKEDLYYVGGSNNNHDTIACNTPKLVNELLEEAKNITTAHLEVIEQHFAFRPISKDRRPIVGEHPQISNLFIINGMGTRGTLLGAYSAEQLFQHIENQQAINQEIDCARFEHLYPN